MTAMRFIDKKLLDMWPAQNNTNGYMSGLFFQKYSRCTETKSMSPVRSDSLCFYPLLRVLFGDSHRFPVKSNVIGPRMMRSTQTGNSTIKETKMLTSWFQRHDRYHNVRELHDSMSLWSEWTELKRIVSAKKKNIHMSRKVDMRCQK